MWFITIISIITGLMEIRYAFKVVEKSKKGIRLTFILMGILTTMVGFSLIIIDHYFHIT